MGALEMGRPFFLFTIWGSAPPWGTVPINLGTITQVITLEIPLPLFLNFDLNSHNFLPIMGLEYKQAKIN